MPQRLQKKQRLKAQKRKHEEMGINIRKKKKCEYQTLKQGKKSYKYQRNKIALFEFYSERISHSEDSACIVKICNK